MDESLRYGTRRLEFLDGKAPQACCILEDQSKFSIGRKALVFIGAEENPHAHLSTTTKHINFWNHSLQL
jgi:hypothetical protein